MKTIILIYQRCPTTGELGLMLEGVDCDDLAAATEGVLIAHDVLEHNGPDTIDSIGQELEAFGALWWIRGSLGDLQRDTIGSRYSPAEHLAFDIARLAADVYCHHRTFGCVIPNTKACPYDKDFEDILCLARQQLRETVNYTDSLDHRVVDTYCEGCLAFLRSGYRKATRRYRRLGQLGANRLFWTMVEAVNQVLTYLDYPGQRVKLQYCLTTAKVYADIFEDGC